MRALVSLAAGAVALFLAGLQPTQAQIPGQGASAFATAVEDWLEAEEGPALEALAALAAEDNAAAQLLLALIDKTPALQGPWLARLPREARVTLMRRPGGLSGRSWMSVAARQTPVAELWLTLWDVDAPMTLALDFAAAGEPRAARAALVALAARERRGFAGIADAEGYPPSLRFLVWREWAGDPARAAALEAEVAALSSGDPQRLELGQPLQEAALADWLLAAPEAAVLVRLCRDRCGASQRACALAGMEALGSYRSLLVFGSPSEALIPTERFAASPRGQAALLRRMLLAVDARGRRGQMAAAEARDPCLAGLLEAEAKRYMPRRDPPPEIRD